MLRPIKIMQACLGIAKLNTLQKSGLIAFNAQVTGTLCQ